MQLLSSDIVCCRLTAARCAGDVRATCNDRRTSSADKFDGSLTERQHAVDRSVWCNTYLLT